MSTTLLDNLNSDFLRAFSALQSKEASKRVLVYVESDEDIGFWRNILLQFESNKITFDIQLPFKNGIEKGKKAALEKSGNLLDIGVGEHLIVCLDSDYDYLLQDKTEQSRKINNSDFIFQTYTYSIENFLCYSESLHAICAVSTKNDKKIVEFDSLLSSYSTIIYDLFLWSIYFATKNDTTTFTISDFCEVIKITDKVKVESIESNLQNLQKKVEAKRSDLEISFKHEKNMIEKLKEDLRELGVIPENTYLFAQGHTIKDNVVLMFLNPIFLKLKKEKEDEIKNKAKHSIELNNQINLYKKHVISIDTTLNCNTNYKSCFLYSKLHNDLVSYSNKILKKSM